MIYECPLCHKQYVPICDIDRKYTPDHVRPDGFQCGGRGYQPKMKHDLVHHEPKPSDHANIHFYDQPRTPMHHERLREAIEAQSCKPMEILPAQPCTADVTLYLGKGYHDTISLCREGDSDRFAIVNCKASEAMRAVQEVERVQKYLIDQYRAAYNKAEAERKAKEKAAA